MTDEEQYRLLMHRKERMAGHHEMWIRDTARDVFDRKNSRVVLPVRRPSRYRAWYCEGDTLPAAGRTHYDTLELTVYQPLFDDDNGLLVIEDMIRRAYDEVRHESRIRG